MSDRPTIFITAADVSGDVHAAGLIEELRQRLPAARCVGIGGQAMAEAGCELLDQPVRRASMATGAFAHLRYFHKLIRRTRRAMADIAPDVHVPVDSPALNWHLARAARKLGAGVMYYIAPQVWAWARWRVRRLARLTDAVACILPFEADYLRPRGVNAHFVGHPLFDHLPQADPPDLDRPAAEGTWRIALLPGSREGEIRAHAPALAAVARRLSRRWPRAEFVFTAFGGSAAEMIRQSCPGSDLPVEVGNTSQVLARSHFAVAASGTVTIQAAHFGVPMVIFYRVSKWPYRLLGRWLIRTPFLSLVNILAGRRLLPELMPWYGDADALAEAAEGMLDDLPALKRTREELLEVVAPLRADPPATAAGNAAELVIATMNQARGGSSGPSPQQ